MRSVGMSGDEQEQGILRTRRALNILCHGMHRDTPRPSCSRNESAVTPHEYPRMESYRTLVSIHYHHYLYRWRMRKSSSLSRRQHANWSARRSWGLGLLPAKTEREASCKVQLDNLQEDIEQSACTYVMFGSPCKHLMSLHSLHSHHLTDTQIPCPCPCP